MGRLREAVPREADFVIAMEEELNCLVTDDPDRETTLERANAAYDASLRALEEYAEGAENREELLALLAARQPSREKHAQVVQTRVIQSSPGIPASAPRETWHIYAGSQMTPDYHFLREPAWDHDDSAEYCLAESAKPSFTRVFVVWLAHQAAVGKIAAAKDALEKAFRPLVKSLVNRYASSGVKEFGCEYRGLATNHLEAELRRLIEDFDFFFKRWHKVGPLSWETSSLPFRESRHVTSDLELPIGHYLKSKLESCVRQLVGLSSRGFSGQRVRGPFRVKREELRAEASVLEVLLVEDAAELLGVQATQVRRRIEQGHLRAWKAAGFRDLCGVPGGEELVLENRVGDELALTTQKYWLIDLESVLEFLEARDQSGALNAKRRGRPRKPNPR
jgi:hypothetical protein